MKKFSVWVENRDLSAVAKKAGVNLSKYKLHQVKVGMGVEKEHKDVTGGDPVKTFKIVVAHLDEDPNYYTKLKSVMP